MPVYVIEIIYRLIMLDTLDYCTYTDRVGLVKLCTTHWDSDDAGSIPTLQSPPIVLGASAALLSQCQMRRIPGIIFLIPTKGGEDLSNFEYVRSKYLADADISPSQIFLSNNKHEHLYL